MLIGCTNSDNIDDDKLVVNPTPTPNPEPTPDPDPTPDPEPTPTPDPQPKAVGEWQNSVSVEIASVKLKNDFATFGQKNAAQKSIDSTDLKALPAPNWGQDKLEVIFELDGKEFNTVFQNVSEEEVQETELVVRTNQEGREVRISFNGIAQLSSEADNTGRTIYTAKNADSSNRLMERMKLVDSVAKVEVPFVKDGKLQSYVFTMDNNEKERKFTIVLDTKKVAVSGSRVSQPKSLKMSKFTVEDEVKAEINLDAHLDDDSL